MEFAIPPSSQSWASPYVPVQCASSPVTFGGMNFVKCSSSEICEEGGQYLKIRVAVTGYNGFEHAGPEFHSAREQHRVCGEDCRILDITLRGASFCLSACRLLSSVWLVSVKSVWSDTSVSICHPAEIIHVLYLSFAFFQSLCLILMFSGVVALEV